MKNNKKLEIGDEGITTITNTFERDTEAEVRQERQIAQMKESWRKGWEKSIEAGEESIESLDFPFEIEMISPDEVEAMAAMHLGTINTSGVNGILDPESMEVIRNSRTWQDNVKGYTRNG